jgi:hypothetical protein
VLRILARLVLRVLARLVLRMLARLVLRVLARLVGLTLILSVMLRVLMLHTVVMRRVRLRAGAKMMTVIVHTTRARRRRRRKLTRPKAVAGTSARQITAGAPLGPRLAKMYHSI